MPWCQPVSDPAVPKSPWGLLDDAFYRQAMPAHVGGLPVQEVELFPMRSATEGDDPRLSCSLLGNYSTHSDFCASSPFHGWRTHARLLPEGIDLGPVDAAALRRIFDHQRGLDANKIQPTRGVLTWAGVVLDEPTTFVPDVGDRNQYTVAAFRNIILAKARAAESTGAQIDDASLVSLLALSVYARFHLGPAKSFLKPVAQQVHAWIARGGVPAAWHPHVVQSAWAHSVLAPLDFPLLLVQVAARELSEKLPSPKVGPRVRI